MQQQQLALAFSTFPDAESARSIAEQLVTRKLVACANILPSVQSIYRWQGKLENPSETLVVFKLPLDGYTAFETELKALHPYDVPEIIAVSITQALPAYLQWVVESCS